MGTIAERYRRLSGEFADRIAAVPDDQWANPSPCEDWTALDVVRHVVDSQRRFLGLVGREPGPVPDVADDPAGAWDAARAAVQADLDNPARASAEYDGRFGRGTFEKAVDRFGNLDLVVHGWDLAHATGQDERLDPADVRMVAASFDETMRGQRAFGPPVEVPAGADEQTRMLALLGRRP